MTTETATYTPFELAGMADVASPDSVTSAGAEWLALVAGRADEYSDDTEYLEDWIAEVADSVVPIYTHRRWLVFVDLAAYTEDTTELGVDGSDMTQAAGVALYMIAERLLAAVLEDRGVTR